MSSIHLGIDASNIRQGGGVTHLSQMLRAARLDFSEIKKVTVCCCRSTASQLPDHPWLTKYCPAWADAPFLFRLFGQQFSLLPALEAAGCDVLFSPGGTLPVRCSIPTVTMSQNLLPFDPSESARFGQWSPMRLKMRLLRVVQERSFKNADGVIFLTEYAKAVVLQTIGGTTSLLATIPHGIEERFLAPPRAQRTIESCSTCDPFRLLYVSILMPYKHHFEVAKAASLIRAEGIPLSVRFIGSDWGNYGVRFNKLLASLDKKGEFLQWSGAVPFSDLHNAYRQADAFVFASSCENLPNILIEAMSAGLPIASSRTGPMPEVLGDAGVYFDPDDPTSIATTLRELILTPALREKLGEMAWQRSQAYSWERCAKETFQFIADVAR